MARSEKQKQKLFRLLEIFREETDESHGLTMSQIISRLSDYGISAERKSIYDDILTLGELGYDVVTLPARPPKYTLLTRDFELGELKMLVDAVETSKFITIEKSRDIIRKLRVFAGKYHSGELSRQVYVEERIKTENDFAFDNIDAIHKAINGNFIITFKYFGYTVDKKRSFRHGGKRYRVSPASLVLSDENYYLVAYDEDEGKRKNFRVDKMCEIEITDLSRSADVTSQRFNPAEYSRKIFGMYGGREELVTLECREDLAGVIIDRFGTDYAFIKTPFGFRVTLRVIVSPTFYAWALGFGCNMRIISPGWVRDELLCQLKDIEKIYESEKKS